MLLLVGGFCRPFCTLCINFFNFSGSGLYLLTESYHVPAFFSRTAIKNDATCLDDLLRWAKSTVLEAQLMSHDAGVTAAELYTHLHMLRRRTVLESPSVDLPQRDRDRLLVMSLGGNDLFGPNTHKVQEWKKGKAEEKVKMRSRVFEERENREKAARKETSSSVRPPRSLSHQSPLDAINPPRTKDSYHRLQANLFRRDSNKQYSFRSRPSSCSKGQEACLSTVPFQW